MTNKIVEILATLDPKNPDHWTKDGAPDLKAVQTALGNFDVRRKDLVEAAPLFTKERALAGFAPDAPAAEAPPPVVTMLEADEVGETEVAAEVAPLGKTVKELQAELTEINVRKNAILLEFNTKQKEVDEAIEAGESGNEPFHETMAAYKRAQQEDREQRGDNRILAAALSELGVLKTRAPLDAALARKQGRGVDRPKFGT